MSKSGERRWLGWWREITHAFEGYHEEPEFNSELGEKPLKFWEQSIYILRISLFLCVGKWLSGDKGRAGRLMRAPFAQSRWRMAEAGRVRPGSGYASEVELNNLLEDCMWRMKRGEACSFWPLAFGKHAVRPQCTDSIQWTTGTRRGTSSAFSPESQDSPPPENCRLVASLHQAPVASWVLRLALWGLRRRPLFLPLGVQASCQPYSNCFWSSRTRCPIHLPGTVLPPAQPRLGALQ